MPLVRLRLFRWLLLLGFVLLAAVNDGRLTAQDQSKKAPPKEVEDPAAKGKTKAVPRLDDQPSKTDPAQAEGPGILPPPGTLVVAVRSLPELMSPALARSDSEKYVLDLLFEGLLRPVADSVSGVSYEPALARELPRLIPRGREFTLTQATWADPAHPDAREPVTTADVRSTVDKLRARKGQPGAEVGELIDAINATDSRERCQVFLKQGRPDPLALMTFKILPGSSHDDEAFARKPIGSGPFMYAGRVVEGGRTYAVFPANPAYGARPERKNRPSIREVRLLASNDPVADFEAKRAQMMLTTHTGEVVRLKAAPKPGEDVQPQGRMVVVFPDGSKMDSLPSRRIYFLAVNHAYPALGGANGRELRHLIAHAIQRDNILSTCFRSGYADVHQPLDGPFPPDTWPCKPNLTRLEDADLANDYAKRVKAPLTLDLKYPSDDGAVAQACQMIQMQLAEFKITLKLIPLEPTELRKQIAVGDFHLAYWHYDYPDEWFSPASLFDPRALGNRNFMHYQPSPEFGQLLARCQNYRDFGMIREAMQQLHTTFRTEMPFIPLWHLNTHVLIASNLNIEPSVALLDPLAPFTHIDQWQFKP